MKDKEFVESLGLSNITHIARLLGVTRQAVQYMLDPDKCKKKYPLDTDKLLILWRYFKERGESVKAERIFHEMIARQPLMEAVLEVQKEELIAQVISSISHAPAQHAHTPPAVAVALTTEIQQSVLH